MSTPAPQYGDNPDFDEQVDQDYDSPIEICGGRFRVSEILFSMAPETYRIAVEEFRQRQMEMLQDTVCDEFPFPIAHNYDRFVNGFKDQKDRLEHLRNTWEATISLLFALVIGEARLRQIPLTEVRMRREGNQQAVNLKHLFTDKLATRLDVAKAIMEHAADRVAMSISEYVPVTVIERIRKLNQVRNKLAHRSPVSEAQAKEVIEECQDDVLGVLTDLRRLRDISLIRYMSNRGLVIQHERFRGAGIRRDIKEVRLVPAEKTYWDKYCMEEGRTLAVIGGTPVSLQPFVCCKERESGHLTRVCFFKKTSSANTYEFEDLAESEFVTIEPVTYRDDVNELRTLLGLSPA